MNNVYLLTGGNIGDRLQILQQACEQVEKQVGAVLQKSSIYETAAWGFTNQAPFLNQVLSLQTDFPAEDLLQILLNIERSFGRVRQKKMGPRIIDLDILFYNNEIISTPDLTVPHLQVANRRFVLVPLHEIAPDFIHPVLNKTIHELLEDCPDQLEVKRLSEP